MTATVTAQDMRIALYRHFAGQAAVLFEISTNPREEAAADPRRLGVPLLRRRAIDVLTVRTARKRGIGPLDLLAVEIKVDRGDYLTDIRDPAKQAGWREIAHRHAYAVPDGLVQPGEIPEGSGLLVAKPATWDGGDRTVTWARRAPYTTAPDLPAWLTLRLAWRLSTAEAKIRGVAWETRDLAGDTPDDLRARLLEARAETERLTGRLNRARDETDTWRTAFAAAGYLPCAHCAQPVRPERISRGNFSGWRHRHPRTRRAVRGDPSRRRRPVRLGHTSRRPARTTKGGIVTVTELPVNGSDPRDDDPGWDRTPPNNVAAEQCVLGGMLLSKDAISDVIDVIRLPTITGPPTRSSTKRSSTCTPRRTSRRDHRGG